MLQVLIGASATPGLFTPEILQDMAEFNERPIVFALSNPTSRAECTAEQAFQNTKVIDCFSWLPFSIFHFILIDRSIGMKNFYSICVNYLHSGSCDFLLGFTIPTGHIQWKNLVSGSRQQCIHIPRCVPTITTTLDDIAFCCFPNRIYDYSLVQVLLSVSLLHWCIIFLTMCFWSRHVNWPPMCVMKIWKLDHCIHRWMRFEKYRWRSLLASQNTPTAKVCPLHLTHLFIFVKLFWSWCFEHSKTLLHPSFATAIFTAWRGNECPFEQFAVRDNSGSSCLIEFISMKC